MYGGWSDSSTGMAFAWHEAALGSIPGISYGPRATPGMAGVQSMAHKQIKNKKEKHICTYVHYSSL